MLGKIFGNQSNLKSNFCGVAAAVYLKYISLKQTVPLILPQNSFFVLRWKRSNIIVFFFLRTDDKIKTKSRIAFARK